jgi:hypothetical protein
VPPARKFGENGHFCDMHGGMSEWVRGGEGTEPQEGFNWASTTTVAVPAAASRRGHFGRFVLFVWEN